MNKRSLIILFLFSTLVSCGTFFKKVSGFKNPKVENKQTLYTYFTEAMPNEKTYFLTVEKIADSTAIFNSFLYGFTSDMKIFSKAGQKYCYNGTGECSGSQMTSAFNNFNDTYTACVEETDENLTNILSKLNDENGNKITIDDLPESDYYIFQNWNKYSNSKKSLRQDAKWISNLKENSTINATIIFINGDLLEDWGLEENGELKTKFRKDGNGLSFSIIFGKLPYKN